MYRDLKIKPPFFEIGPKAYLYGDEMLRLAKEIDRIAVKYDVDIIVTPQYTDIRLLAENTERILVFAQHMDCLPVGRGLGSVLPEAVKAAGAKGVMLNHAEKPLDRETLAKTIARADDRVRRYAGRDRGRCENVSESHRSGACRADRDGAGKRFELCAGYNTDRSGN